MGDRIDTQYKEVSGLTGRLYDKEKDRDAVIRIWKECGWIKDEKKDGKIVDTFISNALARVGCLTGQAECFVLTSQAELMHGAETVPHCAVSAVNTSHIARKRGLAGKVLAESLAIRADKGDVTSGLGIFEQGFYDRHGYAPTPYEHWIRFDPAQFKIDESSRVPVRLSKEDHGIIFRNLQNRMKCHGAVTITDPKYIRAELLVSNGFGFGYKNGRKLTHHMWIHSDQMEDGPYNISWMAYETPEQLRELLALLSSLGDQVKLVRMREPSWLQLQDFIEKPLKFQRVTRGTPFGQQNRAICYHEMRILNVEEAVKVLKTADGSSVAFNAKLSDPIERFLDDTMNWKGCGGEYSVVFGPKSTAKPGFDEGLPLMEADIGTFSRLWLGALSPKALAFSGSLRAPVELIERLEPALRFPTPSPDWDY